MRIAVIGSGVSGIATTHYLRQRNIDVDLYEAAANIGGRIGNEQLLGRRVDFGGKNIGKHYTRFREFVKACGKEDFEYFGLNTSQLINGKIFRISREGARVSNLLKMIYLCGFEGTIKLYPMIRAIQQDWRQGALGSDYFRQVSDRLDHLSLAEYLNRNCVRHIVRPITIRMNGAEPEECYPGNFGSNLALAIDSYEQLRCGMHGLLDAFMAMQTPESLRIFLQRRVSRLAWDAEKRAIRIDFRNDENGAEGSETYDRVISALPALRLADALSGSLPEASALLRRVRYFPVAIAIVKYHQDVFEKTRRAMMFDSSVALSNAGAYGVNDLYLVRYTFSGRTFRDSISADTTAESVIRLGEQTVAPYLSMTGNRREALTYKYLQEGLCAYSARHHLLLEELDRVLKQLPGFSTTGDYRRGASIEACFRSANECVKKAMGESS